MSNFEQVTFEIPATPFLVDTVGYLMILATFLTIGTMSITAAQHFKARTLSKIRHEYGARAAKEAETSFAY